VVNVVNLDYRCVGYAILAAILNIKIHPERIFNYKEQYFIDYKLNAIEYPVIPTTKIINEISIKLSIDIIL
jgi:hypothetical protein